MLNSFSILVDAARQTRHRAREQEHESDNDDFRFWIADRAESQGITSVYGTVSTGILEL